MKIESIVVVCNRCRAELDTGQNHKGKVNKIARSHGWHWRDRGGLYHLCPECIGWTHR